MLRAAKAPKEFIDAAKAHRCEACDTTKPKPQTHKVGRPKPYTFNHEVGIDVFEVTDATGTRFEIRNAVDMCTTYDQAWIVRHGTTIGPPSSAAFLKAFMTGWVRWAGWPRYIACDRGVHNRGTFSQTVGKQGVRIRSAGLESSEQIGRVERRNGVLKRMIKKVVKETNATGVDQMEMILTESLAAVNEMTRHGVFAPVQWVLSRFPRAPATQGDEQEFADIGAIQGHVDGATAFAI